jgi:hypothetical protein
LIVTKVEAWASVAWVEKESKPRASEAVQEADTPLVHLDESVFVAQSYSSAQLPPGYLRRDSPADFRRLLMAGTPEPV